MNFKSGVSYQPQNIYNNSNPQQYNPNLNQGSQSQYIFSENVLLKYTNPASNNLSSGSNPMHQDFLAQLDKVTIPELTNIQNILFACESTKNEYINYIGLDFKLDDMLKKVNGNATTTTVNYSQQNGYNTKPNNQNYQQNSQYQYNQVQNSQNNMNQYSNNNNQNYNQNYNQNNYGNNYQNNNYGGGYQNNYHIPSVNTKDIERFSVKFKCSKEMALTYLEAFQSYEEAETQFIVNTGWKE